MSVLRGVFLKQKKIQSLVFTTDSSSEYVPDVVCFASVYHTNMDHLSTTPTQI